MSTKKLNQMSNDEIKDFQKNIKKDLNKSIREVERLFFKSERQKNDAKKELEKAVKEGKDRSTCKIYANNFILAKRNYEGLMQKKSTLKTLEFQINSIISQVKLSNTLGQNNEILKSINTLVNIPEISNIINNMQLNMDKVGILGEQVDEAMEDYENDMDVDEEVDDLLNKINGQLKNWDDADVITNPTNKNKIGEFN